MTSLAKFACAFLLAGGLAAPALAAEGDAGSGPTTGATAANDAGAGPTQGAAKPDSTGQTADQNGQNGMNSGRGENMHIAQKLREDLTKAGFTDIAIMPSSFQVRAKDSAGNRVMLLINPDSMTAITEETQGSNSASNSKHMGGSGSSNSAGATPGASSTGGSQPVTPGGASKP